MTDIDFLVAETPKRELLARAVGQSIFVEADDIRSLCEQVRDAVHCHFEDGCAPSRIRLHFRGWNLWSQSLSTVNGAIEGLNSGFGGDLIPVDTNESMS